MAKTKEIESFLEDMSNNLFGTSRIEAFKDCTCVICKEKVQGFKDDVSFKEYKLSGMCQVCQDATFRD